mmetsp:Transcript_7484/g.14615  ORF Transcript_7484/g.14615 Transcript_7484/m.14615 type:complete len:211 (+) Transcript_7484:250-882(+)
MPKSWRLPPRMRCLRSRRTRPRCSAGWASMSRTSRPRLTWTRRAAPLPSPASPPSALALAIGSLRTMRGTLSATPVLASASSVRLSSPSRSPPTRVSRSCAPSRARSLSARHSRSTWSRRTAQAARLWDVATRLLLSQRPSTALATTLLPPRTTMTRLRLSRWMTQRWLWLLSLSSPTSTRTVSSTAPTPLSGPPLPRFCLRRAALPTAD